MLRRQSEGWSGWRGAAYPREVVGPGSLTLLLIISIQELAKQLEGRSESRRYLSGESARCEMGDALAGQS